MCIKNDEVKKMVLDIKYNKKPKLNTKKEREKNVFSNISHCISKEEQLNDSEEDAIDYKMPVTSNFP